MFERVWYKFENEQEKKDILLAFKNETKFTKKIPIYKENEEEHLTKIIKIDTYSTYFDFWLDNFIQSTEVENGMVKKIELYDKENSKGVKQKRIKKITV
jgi:hypothetical protein